MTACLRGKTSLGIFATFLQKEVAVVKRSLRKAEEYKP